jgi:4-amino-4-deoxy-L-arabinose transferase-like glycosyltransferase
VSGLRKHIVLALLVGLGLRLVFVFYFPGNDDDSKIYQALAQSLVDQHTYGMILHGHMVPLDVRPPGYPVFLAALYLFFGTSTRAILLAQIVLDLLTCVLTALLVAQLVPEASRRRAAIAALWLAATCPFVANYAAVALTEVLATLLTTAALVALVRAYRLEEGARADSASDDGASTRARFWLAGGLLAGLCTLVRPETPVLLAAVALVLAVRWCARAEWPRLVRAGALMAFGLLLPLLPWAARNWITLHEVQFLAPPYIQLPGRYVNRGFFAWTNTWLVRYQDIDGVLFHLDHEPIQMDDIPASAFDNAEEGVRVDALLQEERRTLEISPEVDRQFADLARERTARHPLRTYVKIPALRTATLWFTPRTELLPYSGELWLPAQQWEDDAVDFSVTLALGLINLFYISLALASAWRWRHEGAVWLLVAFILVRTIVVAAEHYTPEPRYVLECFPAVLALGGLVWARRSSAA